MSFSSRRRNYLLTPHRRDGLIEWMKAMLQHSFVLDSLETTGADTFEHFEVLIEEHRSTVGKSHPSRLQQLVPTTGTFHTPLPLRDAFEAYNAKHKLTKRKHIQISFNELRHILNLAQIMALANHKNERDVVKGDPATTTTTTTASSSVSPTDEPVFNGPKLISFDGDQTLYSDGANFESNEPLAHHLYTLLRHGVAVAIVTAAGYEYQVEKYEYRLSGLLRYFAQHGLTQDECDRFYLFGGECNYLMKLGLPDYKLIPIRERGPGGWCTATQFLPDAPAQWNEAAVQDLLDCAQTTVQNAKDELGLTHARVIRKKRSVGLVPTQPGSKPLSRESLDETVLRVHELLQPVALPYCAFNGGTDAWVDVGNKRVGVQILQAYLGVTAAETLHIGDQFLNTGNDFAARDVSPCIWIISPAETTYILKTILRLAGVATLTEGDELQFSTNKSEVASASAGAGTLKMDVYTGKMVPSS